MSMPSDALAAKAAPGRSPALGIRARMYLPLLAGAVLAAALLAVVYVLHSSYVAYLVDLCLINALCAIGLSILAGSAGQLSLGTAAIQAVSAYTVAILAFHYHVPYVVGALVGAGMAMLVGTLVAAPALRLTGLHVPVLTMAFGVITLQLIGKGGDLTGGTSGLSLPPIDLLGLSLRSDMAMLCVITPVFVLGAWSSWVFLSLKPGRALRMLRFNETAARTQGVDTAFYKIVAFAFSAFLIGLGGALYAGLTKFVSVDDFGLENSIYFFVMIAIGGMTSIAGAIIGAVFVTLLPEVMRSAASAAPFVFGICFILINFYLPGGLMSLPGRFRDGLFRIRTVAGKVDRSR